MESRTYSITLITCIVVLETQMGKSMKTKETYENKWGWRWPCFETDLSAFLKTCKLLTTCSHHKNNLIYKEKQRGLFQNKVTCSLTAIQRPSHWTHNCKMVHYSVVIDKAWKFIWQIMFKLLLSWFSVTYRYLFFKL